MVLQQGEAGASGEGRGTRQTWWVAGHGLMQPLAPLRSILAFHLSVSLCSHPQLTHCQSPLQPLLHLLDCQGEGQP